jgi:hypothetical protein
MIACRCDVHTTDHSLELDERVSFVVEVGWTSLATGTEVGVVTYGTLVAVSNNIRRLVATEWSVAVDAIVASLSKLSSTGIADWFIDGNEAMSGVDEAGIDNTCRAIVPVRAVEALVTDTKDVLLALALHFQRGQAFAYLVTTITNGVVARVAAWLKKSLGKRIQGHIFNSRSKGMLWVVAMLKTHMTWNAEIKVITGSASDKAFLGKLCDTWLAWCWKRQWCARQLTLNA